ncbi:glycosyltransferase [Methanobacterium sp.]|uniref:glycosyltransferase n=1 Tax=Methanobacterium sp. TaxID=2164 RepID=UPI0025F1DD32|nr:glycosyltransferase [Methanobacterium sp.]MBI5459244.1 glycosyltransferase [Methanobacterium sp.]
MKILQVIEWFFPRSGVVQSTYNLTKELICRGHDVTIITTDFDFDEDFAKGLENVEIIKFKTISSKFNFIYSPSMKIWLKENLESYDVIHLQDFRTYQNWVVHKYAKRFKIPYSLQAHGSVLPFFSNELLKKIYDLFFGYDILNHADKLIALTDVEVEQYKLMGVDEKKIVIVPNGIDINQFKNLPSKGKFKDNYCIQKNERVILYLGRINKIKGIDLLVNAFLHLTKELDNIRLVIVGPDSGFLSELEKQIDPTIKNKMLFTGPLYGKDKLEAYVDADVYVLPSIYETFPLTVLESLACGTPVVVTDVSGISDIIDNKVGFVVKESNAMTKAMLTLLKDPKLSGKFSVNGKKVIKEEFSLEIVVEKMECVYKEIIHKY